MLLGFLSIARCKWQIALHGKKNAVLAVRGKLVCMDGICEWLYPQVDDVLFIIIIIVTVVAIVVVIVFTAVAIISIITIIIIIIFTITVTIDILLLITI